MQRTRTASQHTPFYAGDFDDLTRSAQSALARVLEQGKGRLEDVDGQHAAGLLVGDGCEATLLVRTREGISSYRIDRWE